MTRPTPQRGQQPEEPGASGQASPAPPPPPPPPPPAPSPTPTAGAPAAPVAASGGIAYTVADMKEAALTLGIHPWDVAGIFFAKHTERMTMAEFDAALKEWRTPPPHPQPQQAGQRQQRGGAR